MNMFAFYCFIAFLTLYRMSCLYVSHTAIDDGRHMYIYTLEHVKETLTIVYQHIFLSFIFRLYDFKC